jgi:hypothetical protein
MSRAPIELTEEGIIPFPPFFKLEETIKNVVKNVMEDIMKKTSSKNDQTTSTQQSIIDDQSVYKKDMIERILRKVIDQLRNVIEQSSKKLESQQQPSQLPLAQSNTLSSKIDDIISRVIEGFIDNIQSKKMETNNIKKTITAQPIREQPIRSSELDDQYNPSKRLKPVSLVSQEGQEKLLENILTNAVIQVVNQIRESKLKSLDEKLQELNKISTSKDTSQPFKPITTESKSEKLYKKLQELNKITGTSEDTSQSLKPITTESKTNDIEIMKEVVNNFLKVVQPLSETNTQQKEVSKNDCDKCIKQTSQNIGKSISEKFSSFLQNTKDFLSSPEKEKEITIDGIVYPSITNPNAENVSLNVSSTYDLGLKNVDDMLARIKLQTESINPVVNVKKDIVSNGTPVRFPISVKYSQPPVKGLRQNGGKKTRKIRYIRK